MNPVGAPDDVMGPGELVRRPSAILPFIFSAAALLILLVHLGIHGAAREADEGAAAHLWQLLMAGQLPVILFFAIRWWPRAPRAALLILAGHGAAALCAALPVYFLGL